MGATSGPAAAASGTVAVATATTKLRPPGAPSSLLRRERLVRALDEALARRLTTVVAGAGFGKSTLLAAWAADVNCAWYTASTEDTSVAALARGLSDALRLRVPALPADAASALTSAAGPGADRDEAARAQVFVALVCETLQAELGRDLVLAVDDVHDVAQAPGATRLIESLCRQAPERLHVVLASREELPFPIERLRGQGQVLELSGSELSFDVDETAALLASLVDVDDAALAVELHRLTGGWPAAVRLAAETLRNVAGPERGAALERMRQPGGPLLTYLAAEVFSHEPSEVTALVRLVAPLDRFSASLCGSLGVADAGDALHRLRRRGLVVELRGQAVGWYSLAPAVREFALSQLCRDEGDRRSARIAASRWFEEQHEPEEALRCLSPAQDRAESARLLTSRGDELLARGAVDAVIEALAQLPGDLRTAPLEILGGEASQIRGDWDEALRCFERAAGGRPALPPGLAWRTGLLLHLGGRLDEALETYSRADDTGEPRDVALLLAWRAAAHWLRADADACRVDAAHAFSIASAASDPQALAAAHTVLAMLAALEGDRGANDAHYLRALDYAERAGDVLQLIRIRTNRGSRHVEECAYAEAISELEIALRLADLAGFAAFRALALTNRGEALARLGRFDEAIADLVAARDLYQRLGSRMVAYPLEKLGDVHRIRGEWTLARAAFEEALAHSEAAGDLQGLVPTLTGLARVLAADEPGEADRLVRRALTLGPGMNHAHVLLAASWVALVRGDRDSALERAAEAAAEAGVRRDRGALAESLELRALAGEHAERDAERLTEAAAIWHELGNPAGEARAHLLVALLTGDADAAARTETELAAVGARGYRSSLALVAPPSEGPPVVVEALGRFRVVRDGEPVPAGAWQSRKARDLLKMLVARRGRPTPRDVLMEALWPGQSPAPLGNRLSVLLSTVRSVLDAQRRYEQDHFVGADKSAVWLRYEHVAVDAETFLADALDALGRARDRAPNAYDRLAAAEAAYTGDLLEEDAYEDWAIGLREELRTTYVAVVRALAELAAATGDVDATVRYSLRLLERDPYDEPAHLGLVAALEAAGRHGEARRRFRVYAGRMDEIGVEAAPFPASRG